MGLNQARLHKLMCERLNINDLKTLCTKVEEDYEDLPDSQTHTGLARELIRRCIQRVKEHLLIEKLKELRGEHSQDWDACLGMPLRVTLHTSVLMHAFTQRPGVHRELVSKITDSHTRVCIDFPDGAIQRQYYMCLPKEVLDFWFYDLQRHSQLELVQCGSLSASHITALTAIVCHSRDNEMFLSVADATDRVLIAEDDSLGNGPSAKAAPLPTHITMQNYLTSSLHLIVYDAAAAISRL